MKNIFFYETNIGKIGIQDNGEAITGIYFNAESTPEDAALKETELIKEAASQIKDYFEGKRKAFELPLAFEGTEFMKSVWKALREIPYGETRSYGDIAKSIGNPKAARAVGMANNKNLIPIVIPCHRVIGANGKLVGYAGGLDIKEQLLDLEKQH
jgi:methylated-DNA-[protein]-cysteine S-methyltransferase